MNTTRPFNGYTCPCCCGQTFELIRYGNRLYTPPHGGVLVCTNCGSFVKSLTDSECQQFNHT